MLRSTFAAYNTAHPDKPLINPRNAAAGTLRAKDPATVAERRLSFFAFDLDTSTDPGGAGTGLVDGLRALGFTVADMRHCTDAAAAQAVIGAIKQGRNDLDGAVLRLANRDAYAAAGTRSSSPRGAVGVQVRRRGEDDGPVRCPLGRRQNRQDRSRRLVGAGVCGRDYGHPRDAGQPGGHPRPRHQDR